MAITIPDNDARVQYTATAGQTIFAYDFEIFEEGDLVVVQNDTTLTLTTEYTVSGVDTNGGGNVTLVTGATLNDVITIYRDQPIERTSNYSQAGDLLAETLNDDLGKIVAWGQQLERDVGRAVTLDITSATTNVSITSDPEDGKGLVWSGGNLVNTALDLYDSSNVSITGGSITGVTGVLLDSEFGSNGLMVRTAAGTYTSRTITGTSNQVTVTNGDGVSGNPTLSLPQDIATTSAVTFATVNTGQGANELYAMDQDVQTTDDVLFNSITLGGGSDALRDYVINTFKPVLSGGSTTGTNSYTTQAGRYVRIGDVCVAGFQLILDGTGGALDSTGQLFVSMPFTPSISGYYGGKVICFAGGNMPASNTLTAEMRITGGLTLFHEGNTGVGTFSEADGTDSLSIRGTVVFEIA